MTNTVADASPSGEPSGDPILAAISQLVSRLEDVAAHPEDKLTLSRLVELLGDRSYAILLLALGLLNLLPGPPGYGTALGVLIIGMSIAMMLGRQVRLWQFLGDRNVPTKMLGALLPLLRKAATLIARISEPRLPYLCGPAAMPAIGVGIFLLGLVMLCPIPFTNMLPSWALVALCVGMLNRDGLAVIVGVIVGVIGAIAMVAAVWVTIYLATVVVDSLD